MAGSGQKASLTQDGEELVCSARTPGPTGHNDQGDPNSRAFLGDTPGPVGHNDHAAPPRLYCAADDGPLATVAQSGGDGTGASAPAPRPSPAPGTTPQGAGKPWEPAESGSVPLGVGSGGVVGVARIPVPGSNGLFIELSPRNFKGSTSRVFIQDAKGKRLLRLDFGPNPRTGRVDYHWNQKGTFAQFGIPDHAPAGQLGEGLYRAAKYVKYGGRLLLVVGVVVDVVSVVEAKKKVRQVARVAAGWAGAEAGCELLGGLGRGAGSVEPGGGTAVGGLVGCLVGGIGGYAGALWAAGQAYDFVEETFFEPLPEVPAPLGAIPDESSP